MMTTSEILKHIRAELNITQKSLARSISTAYATVNRCENNKSTPNRMALTLLIDFCEKQGIDEKLVEKLQKKAVTFCSKHSCHEKEPYILKIYLFTKRGVYCVKK